MKLVKLFNKLSAVALATSLVIGFASCSTTTDDPFNTNAPLTLEEYVKSEIKKTIDNGGNPVDPVDPSKPSGSGSLKEAKSLEFHVNANSTDAEHTMIFVKYDRSAYGAEEEVKVTNAELNIYINGAKVKTYDKIDFALDEYGAEISSRGDPISDPKAMKEYKAKLNVGQVVKSSDVVKIELVKASVVKVGAASDKITLANLQFALIDTDASVNYYKELAPNAEQFQNICTLEDLTTGDAPDPTPDPEPDPAPGKTPGEEYEAGNSTVTSIELVKNEYADGGALQTQVKISSGLTSLLVGDKVKVAFKGTADRDIGKVELMIVDTTEAANWWTALSDKKEDNFSTEIDFDFEFEITKAPIGTGANSMVFAINGLDGDTAATITCASFSIEKNADKKPAGAPGAGEGTTPLATLSAWGQGVEVENLNFAEGSTVVIVYKDKTDSGAFKLQNYNWIALTSTTGLEGAIIGDDGSIQPSATEGTIKYVMTAEDVAACEWNKFVLQGEGITIVSLTVEAPTTR